MNVLMTEAPSGPLGGPADVKDIDRERRRFLVAATAVTGVIGLGGVSVPFIESWQPSERARSQGGPVDIDFSKLESGAMMTVAWRGKPVWILRRTPAMLRQIQNARPFLRDPDSLESIQPAYASNATRARDAEYLVVLGVCTHMGCTPKAKFEAGDSTMPADWPGGFFCPCHGSKFDLAGRVFRGVPAPTNLTVPPYEYVGKTHVVIGVDDTHST